MKENSWELAEGLEAKKRSRVSTFDFPSCSLPPAQMKSHDHVWLSILRPRQLPSLFAFGVDPGVPFSAPLPRILVPTAASFPVHVQARTSDTTPYSNEFRLESPTCP